MIDAKELRLGNLFWDEDKTPCYFAGSWQRNDGWINRDSANNTYKDTQMYPIPLTTEILEKCGYVIDGGKHRQYDESGDRIYWNKEVDLILYINTERKGEGYDILINNYEGEFESIGMNINYLHQLQNLIYALTQKELEIKL